MKDLSGSDSIGIKKFYEKTNRFSARNFEDKLSLSFIENNEVKSNLAFYHENCPLCLSEFSHSRLGFVKNGYKHWLCNSCDGIYTNPSLNIDTIQNKVYGKTLYPFFDSVNSQSQISFDMKRFKKTLEKLINNGLKPKGGVMDFGCGSGFFLSLCREYGFEKPMGNDLINQCVENAKINYKLDNIKLIDGFLDISRVDKNTKLVAMWEYLDHINEPHAFLTKLINKIISGTYIIISVRNGHSLAARVMKDECNMFLGHAHFNFWSMKNIKLVIKEFNLNIVDQYQYISEREAVKNFLNFKSIYNSESDELDWLISEQEIFKNNLGYKHVLILKKP